MKHILILFCTLLLSACYAQRLELNDPMGMPLSQATVALSVLPYDLSNAESQESLLASQLEAELIQLLPRERHIKVVAACEDYCPSPQHWSLTFLLKRQEQQWEQPTIGWLPNPSRFRTQIALELQAELLNPEGQSVKTFQFKQKGDAQPEAKQKLESQLLHILRQRAIQELQPQYIYR